MKSVLIIRCGALGDLVYATSVIDALKKEYGEDTQIDFVSTPSNATLFKNDPRVRHIFPLKHKKIPIFLSSQKKAVIKYSKKTPYDILINFESGKQFKSLVNAISATKKVGEFFDTIHPQQDIKHAVELTKYIFKDIVSKENYENSFPKIIGTSSKEAIKKYNLKDKYIIISPSNSHQKKNRLNYRAWEDASWISLIDELSKKTQVVLIGSKNEDQFFNKLKPYPQNVIDLVGKTSLSDLIGVVEGAMALVATDTGTAHIASAVNTEVFALIGPTPAQVTGPYQTPFNKVHIISANLPCSPCYKTPIMKNCKENICMKSISASMVLDTISSANIL